MCLFDLSLYDFKPFDIVKGIRKMVYNEEITFEEERLVLKPEMDGLKKQKYDGMVKINQIQIVD
jgi:hypothetical protein